MVVTKRHSYLNKPATKLHDNHNLWVCVCVCVCVGWFSLNNLETVKDVNLAFCSIEWISIRDILVKFGIPNSPQSSDIGQKSERGVLVNPLYTKIVITPEPVMYWYKTWTSNKTWQEKYENFDDDVMSVNCHVIFIFSNL